MNDIELHKGQTQVAYSPDSKTWELRRGGKEDIIVLHPDGTITHLAE